ncbi:hypothetical protein J3R83DRAFT_4389 [Lanmaoa asiatica]|nr:hypothetical protein J3R83DRAFT_4389 [Lanmaoa asiatica]
MSDLHYPPSVLGDKYASAVLDFIPQLIYSVQYKPDEQIAVVLQKAPGRGLQPTVKTRIPAWYYDHVKRFLWRFYMLYAVYKTLHLHPGSAKRVLLPSGVDFLQRMLVLMDCVVEQLLITCMDLGDNLTEKCRVFSFDLYLSTEFIVGYHDPCHVDAWRKRPEHRDIDLESMFPMVLDWADYDATLGPILSGAEFDTDVQALRKRSNAIKVIDALSQWYQMPLRVISEKDAKKGATEPLVNGTAGLGLRRVPEEQDDEVDGERVPDDAGEEDVWGEHDPVGRIEGEDMEDLRQQEEGGTKEWEGLPDQQVEGTGAEEKEDKKDEDTEMTEVLGVLEVLGKMENVGGEVVVRDEEEQVESTVNMRHVEQVEQVEKDGMSMVEEDEHVQQVEGELVEAGPSSHMSPTPNQPLPEGGSTTPTTDAGDNSFAPVDPLNFLSAMATGVEPGLSG